MFIKYGEEDHISKLKTNGEIFFNPCECFRKLEFEQMQKGIGDREDGGISATCDTIFVESLRGIVRKLENQKSSFIVEPCLKTPTFCLRESSEPYITSTYREKLHIQFPKHTHALVIKNETVFLENIRYHFKSRAFGHQIFYQDYFFTDFMDFLHRGTSDMNFYVPQSKSRYYAIFRCIPNSGGEFTQRVDDSNFYKTMFRKGLFFQDQVEYRIVLPYEKIEKGRLFKIAPIVEGCICKIDDLVR